LVLLLLLLLGSLVLALGLVLCGTLFQVGARGVVVGDKNWPACSTGPH
jgi:hypothetical protein